MAFLLALALALAGCGDKATPSSGDESASTPEEEGHSHASGPHGGQVVIVGDHVAHIEILHEHGAGEAVVHILDGDMKVREIAEAPVLNLLGESGSIRVVGEPGEGGSGPASAWRFRHEALAEGAHEGRLRLKIDGKIYTPDFVHEHEGHDGDEHEGHEDDAHEGHDDDGDAHHDDDEHEGHDDD
jgi:hypothetical protein